MSSQLSIRFVVGAGLESMDNVRVKAGISSPDVTPSEERSLFASAPACPEGFAYQEAFLSGEEERELVARVEKLRFKGFEFQGFVGSRRVVSFGWRYDFNERELQKADDMPPFLTALRQRVAAFAGLDASAFQHVL